MNSDFKIDDLVVLRSGSPVMSVIFVISDESSILNESLKSQGFKNGDVVCQWLDRKNKLKENTFSKESLIGV